MADFEISAQELNQLGENLLKAGKLDDAYEYFQKAEQADPNEITSYINQARAMISCGNLVQAKAALDKALLLDSQCAPALFHMSSVCFLSGLNEEGLLYAGQALDAGYNEPILYVNMAIANEDLGHWDRSIRYYNKAINLAPLEGGYYTAKAECQLRNGRDKDALQTLALLHQNCPDSYEYYHYSYMIYTRNMDFENAQKVLSEGIENFPGDVGLYIDMVHLMNITKHPQEALQLLDALEEVQDSVAMDLRDLKLERAKALLVSEDVQTAKALLQEVINMDDAPNFEAHYLLMNCCMVTSDFEEMDRVARIMIQGDDKSQYAHAARYYLPMSLLKRGLNDQAKPLYEEAIRYYRTETLKHPEQVDAYLFRALCCKDLRRFQEALDVLDYLDKLLPEYKPGQMIRASVYLDMGEKEKASQAYQEAGPLKNALDDIVGPFMKGE